VRQILFGIPILLAALVAGARPGLPRAEPDPASLRFARVMDPVLLADSSDSNGAAWVDVDNDGDEDLFVTGGGGAYNLLYRNDGAAGFSRVLAGELVNIRQQHLGTSWADYNNDGRLDVFVGNNGEAPVLLRNNAGPGNHWVGFRLVGMKCNRDAIGARVTWSVGGVKKTRLKNNGGSYLSSHDPREMIGLGQAAKLDWLEVKWPAPSGRVERFPDVPVDRYFTIVEGKGIAS
jgi:hypothetical protein